MDSEELRIWGPRAADEEEENEETVLEVKAFWTLYIDILFISLDGNPFDVAWASVIGALKDVQLPKATWDADSGAVVCSDSVEEAKWLSLRGLPIAVGFAVFKVNENMANQGVNGKRWLLMDPDSFEEDLCDETVTVLLDCAEGKTKVLGIEKVGGTVVGRSEMRELVTMAETRWEQWNNLFKG